LWTGALSLFIMRSDRRVDTRQKLFNTRARYLLIFGACVLLMLFFFSFLTSPIETQSVKVIEPPAARRVDFTPSPVMEVPESYYRTIIDNNLFRPLGWTPPRPIEPYRLIGTVLPRDENTPPTAIIQTTAGNQKNYIVTIGESLDTSTEVVSIEGKAVTLETDGQRRTLRLTATHYLNPSRVSTRFASRRPTPQRPPQGVRRTPPPTRAPTVALSQWQTREGEVIRIGDARLKNPAKWGLQRRSR
jgi:hypothetical protein